MLELKNIKKSYKTKYFEQNALNNVSITFRKNEFTSILGPSGSGKTTMLNIIGGLDQYDAGDLLIDNISTKDYKAANWDSYRNNRIGFIFQSYNLIVHQSVLANVELALTLSGVSKSERRQRAKAALAEVGLSDHIYKLPTQLSGGQMQRVAIARALINDPEIVLADEPTGALDEKTSGQVMDLLSKIAKDRLVIMVTHNPDLAHKYTNRIIELADGEIVGDSNPYIVDEVVNQNKTTSKTNMSFLTAISLSISNLMTKKVRTFITAIAGSIGIIGIAAILALASGINLYIKDIEQETMSSYPLTIDSSGIDITSFIGAGEDFRSSMSNDNLGDDELPILNSLDTMFEHQSQNDLKSLKAYLEKDRSKIDPYVKNIQYKYGITSEIFLPNEKQSVWQVNPDKLFSEFGLGDVGGLDMISGGSEMGMKTFNELPGAVELYQDQYDVVAGRWPTDIDEAVVVLMDSGALTDFSMYALGLKDRATIKQQLENLADKQTDIIESEELDNIKHAEILAVKFKVIDSAAKYTYDDVYDLWVDKSNDSKHMGKIVNEGIDLKVVGILQASENSNAATLNSGIYYPQGLNEHLIKRALEYDIVNAQLDKPEINVFTNKSFSEEANLLSEGLFDFSDFISIDESQIQNAFMFDESILDLSNLNINLNNIELPALDIADLVNVLSSQINVPTDELLNIINIYINDFIDSQADLEIDNLDEWLANLEEYLADEANLNRLLVNLETVIDDAKIVENLNKTVNNYLGGYINQVLAKVMVEMQNELEQLFYSLPSAISIDEAAFMNAFNFDVDEEEMFDLIRSMGVERSSNQRSNLKLFGYRDLDDPTQINLYPKDFTTKDNVIEYLTQYNNLMKANDEEDKIITYTDFIGALMSSVTTIINTISYALIAFVAISLVVSSIMIGVIIYVSVLERIKEIGILRSIGASKKDIRRVFNAEAIIIGLIAGVLGISITFVISKFANIIVYNTFDIKNIARLEIKAALVLIVISVILAFISGLIPAASAANKDPVDALRSE